jgi:predicted enzyme related to lactoylglutathione lyase
VIGQDNSVCWAELATWDTGQARDFYTALLGWQTKGAANMPAYIEFSINGQPRGGLLPMDEQWKGMPSCWGVYFHVADCDAAVAKAKELGASVRYGPFDAPGVGRMAAVADPQGAGFSLITLNQSH